MDVNKIKTLKNAVANKGNKAVADFISKLFESRTQAHIMHLQTNSYAAHKALDEYYSGIVDLTDDIVEDYQGEYDIVKGYTCGEIKDDVDPVGYISFIRSFIQSNRYTTFKQTDTNLQNIIDEIITLIDSTLYKLKRLS